MRATSKTIIFTAILCLAMSGSGLILAKWTTSYFQNMSLVEWLYRTVLVAVLEYPLVWVLIKKFR